MLQFVKNITQLILSPSRGWEDISASVVKPEFVFKKAYCPLLGIAALTEFVRLYYHIQIGILTVIEMAIALFGSYFVSYFVSRLILDHYLQPLVSGQLNTSKIGVFTLYGLGLLTIIEIVDNLLPTNLTLVKFLPVFVALILYKATRYLSIKPDHELRFLCLAVTAVILVPICFYSILKLIIE